MIWEKIRGHSRQVDMFRRSIGRGRLAHAYLFVGPDGIGKRMFAHALAQCLFCTRFDDGQLEACGECSSCRQMMAGSHPDYLTVGVPAGKKDLPIELIAGPNERRGREGLCYELSLSPMSAERKVAVIDDVNRMNDASGNALLKTLEEPPADSVLILIATDTDSLLPTIRSRCQMVRFAPLSAGDLAELILDLDIAENRDEAETMAALSDGSLSVAKQLADPELRQLRTTLYDSLADTEFDSLAIADEMLAGLDRLGGDAQNRRSNAIWLIRFCTTFFSASVRFLSEGAAKASIPQVEQFNRRLLPATDEDLELLMALFDRSALAAEQIDRMTPVPLCLQALFDELGRMLRSRTRN